MSKRESDIRRIVDAEGTVSVAHLAARLDVSPETVRRDLRPLVASGALVRMHGAVGMPLRDAESPFRRRMQENAEAKRRIATALATQVSDGDVLMMDTGTTTSFVARALAHRRGLTIITNSTDAARTLSGRDNRVFLAGGEMRADSGALLGAAAVAFATGFVATLGIISAGAVDVRGVMDYDPEEADFARVVLAQSARVALVTDVSKFGRRGLVRVCGFDALGLAITDAPVPPPIGAALTGAGVRILVAQ